MIFTTYKLAGAAFVPETGTRFHGKPWHRRGVFRRCSNSSAFLPGSFVPNPNLLPEESEGWDAGIEQQFFGGRLIVDVTYFEQNLLDEIVSVPSTILGPFGFPLFTSANLVGESQRDGIEVDGDRENQRKPSR